MQSVTKFANDEGSCVLKVVCRVSGKPTPRATSDVPSSLQWGRGEREAAFTEKAPLHRVDSCQSCFWPRGTLPGAVLNKRKDLRFNNDASLGLSTSVTLPQ